MDFKYDNIWKIWPYLEDIAIFGKHAPFLYTGRRPNLANARVSTVDRDIFGLSRVWKKLKFRIFFL